MRVDRTNVSLSSESVPGLVDPAAFSWRPAGARVCKRFPEHRTAFPRHSDCSWRPKRFRPESRTRRLMKGSHHGESPRRRTFGGRTLGSPLCFVDWLEAIATEVCSPKRPRCGTGRHARSKELPTNLASMMTCDSENAVPHMRTAGRPRRQSHAAQFRFRHGGNLLTAAVQCTLHPRP